MKEEKVGDMLGINKILDKLKVNNIPKTSDFSLFYWQKKEFELDWKWQAIQKKIKISRLAQLKITS